MTEKAPNLKVGGFHLMGLLMKSISLESVFIVFFVLASYLIAGNMEYEDEMRRLEQREK